MGVISGTIWHPGTRPRGGSPRVAGRHFLGQTYDLPSLLRRHLDSARESARMCEADGDEYGLLDLYREELKRLEGIASRPLPTDSRGQIEWVRQVYSGSGQGVGNVLDVTGVSDRGGMEARRLRQDGYAAPA